MGNCTDCYDSKPKGCCDETEEIDPCPRGLIGTECIVHNREELSSNNLPNIGAIGPTKLSIILKKIDTLLGLTLTPPLSGLNWGSIQSGYNATTIKNILQVIIDTVNTKADKSYVDSEIQKLLTLINSLKTELESGLGIINSEIEILSSDTTKIVFEKIISYIEATPPVQIEFLDTSSTYVDEINSTTFAVNVKVSEDAGNITSMHPDGIYTPGVDVASLFEIICNSPELFTKFSQIVSKSRICFRFFISNLDSRIPVNLSYKNCLGNQATATVNPNSTIELSDVSLMYTSPHTTLIITNKGLNDV